MVSKELDLLVEELVKGEKKVKPRGFWKDRLQALFEARDIMKEQGLDSLPSQGQLKKLGHTSFSAAISKHHGGFTKFRELLGENGIRVEMGKWKDKDFVIAEARRLIEEHGFDTFPPESKLRELKYFGLIGAIRTYHGGMVKFRADLGFDNERVQNGSWKDLGFTIAAVERMMEEQGLEELPSAGELVRLGHSALSQAIRQYHGGFHKFRKTIGQKPLRVKRGSWADLDFTLAEVKKLMEKHDLDTLPTGDELGKLGHSGLVYAIHQHGGFAAFRDLLGEEQRKRESGVWKSLEYTLGEAKRVMEEHGYDRFPSENGLKSIGEQSLAHAIGKYHGGYREFRKHLGEECEIREFGVLKDREYCIKEARRVMGEHDYDTLPSDSVLRSLGASSLGHAIGKYHGGFREFRKLLQEPSEEKLDAVDSLVRDLVEECND